MEEDHNLCNISPTNSIQILNQHDFFVDFVYVLQIIILTKIRGFDVGSGAPQQMQEVYYG